MNESIILLVYMLSYLWINQRLAFMPYKNVNLNFFQLDPTSEDNENRKEDLKAISSFFDVCPDEFLPLPLTDCNINLFGKVEKRHGVFLGTLIKNQTSDIPPSYDEVAGKLEVLPLNESQGLAFQTSFYTHRKQELL